MKIVINPGHGGSDPGATYQGRQEKDDTLRLGLALRDVLQQAGHTVRMTRTDDSEDDITGNCQDANEWGADYLIALHRNAFRPNGASGVENWIYSRTPEGTSSERIAQRIVDKVAACGFVNRGLKRGTPYDYEDYGVTRLTWMPACLLELGFIDSDNDNALFDSQFSKIVRAIAEGITGEMLSSPAVRSQPQAAAKKPATIRPSQGKPKANLVVDGYWGEQTTRALQRYFGTPEDGEITEPSLLVMAMQRTLGVEADGYLGPITISALQRRMGTPVDGEIWRPSPCVKELQKRLNEGRF